MDTKQLRDAALSLPEQERADLAHDLLQSLDGKPDPDVEKAWLEEIERRVRQVADGTTIPEDWGQARGRIERRLRGRGK